MTSNFRIGFTPFKSPFLVERYSTLHFSMYLHQLIVIIITANISFAPDTLFNSLFHYLCGHFDILNNKLKNKNDIIGMKGEKNDAELKSEPRKYRDFIIHHHEMIK